MSNETELSSEIFKELINGFSKEDRYVLETILCEVFKPGEHSRSSQEINIALCRLLFISFKRIEELRKSIDE